MTSSQRQAFEALRELPTDDQDMDEWITLDSVMDGEHEISVSHAGGELSALTDMAEEWKESQVLAYSLLFNWLMYYLAVFIVLTTDPAEIVRSGAPRLSGSRWRTLPMCIWNGATRPLLKGV